MTQHFISVTGKTFLRTKLDGVWNSWSELALKSDLGDPGAFKIVARGVSDLDNPPNAFIIQTTAGNIVGFPTGLNANSCTVYQYNPGDKSYSAQVAFAFGADKIGIRRRNAASGSTAWTGWKYLAFS